MTIRRWNKRRPLRRRLTSSLNAMLLSALLPATGAVAQSGSVMRVERLQIDHRDPSTMREALLPLLSGRESIGVIGDWLVVAATDGTRNRIREQLETLDAPVRRLDLTLSFTVSGDPGQGDSEPVAEPATVTRELTLSPGQTVRLDMPASATAVADGNSTGEADQQLSLQVVINGRQMYLDHVVHPADTPVDPATGMRAALSSDRWQSLTDTIDARVRPQY